MGKVEHVLAGEETGILEPRCQPGGVAKVVPESGESPARALHRHVGFKDAGTDIPRLGILVEEIRQGVQTAWKNNLDFRRS